MINKRIVQRKIRQIILSLFSSAIAASALADDATRVSSQIDWSAAEADIHKSEEKDAGDVKSFRSSGPTQVELDSIRLPVLVPRSEKVRAAPSVGQQEKSYAAVYQLHGANLTIAGSASSINVDPASDFGKLTQQIKGGEQRFEKTEDGADLSLVRYGANYVLRLSCEKPTDARCANSEYLRSVAESLIPVGGKK